ncbi:hypothetical protein IMZ16_04210 [Cruoricaptor ignavus]|uniref:Uncharacterized protein n=1 Tax=Cruoricaptor ignavus TaxID=1118202 RepID=A0A7M1T562_9FLAO|nr:hypothetical protein [Cruoricaptor ignavus]QOR74911.1 hypothetical protein IMZ16_04210 [Cruoricaptor ignavus]
MVRLKDRTSKRYSKLQHLDFDRKTLLNKCRCCKEGNLVTIAVFGQRGPPQEFLSSPNPVKPRRNHFQRLPNATKKAVLPKKLLCTSKF